MAQSAFKAFYFRLCVNKVQADMFKMFYLLSLMCVCVCIFVVNILTLLKLSIGCCVSVEASVHGASIHRSDKTFEAAEALLRMDSPSSLREDRSPGREKHLYPVSMLRSDTSVQTRLQFLL